MNRGIAFKLLRSGSGGIRFPDTYTGDVVETQGPWLGATFNPSDVTRRKVGTATFTGSAPWAATLQYSINGQTVTKNIERQTLRTIAQKSGQALAKIGITALDRIALID